MLSSFSLIVWGLLILLILIGYAFYRAVKDRKKRMLLPSRRR
ncbi:Uncharacterised protein [Serratia odorifera]|uniref:Uncharacterized protein n=2 Tax=Serratia odorifera TaxID=618 RepID=D4DVR6_SEROD|nr:hypothetical protein HMPREF0758_0016 [Serratia odorifera DSM 4582]VDZ51437.1 Uncharacterised protein [Serratia odorifera]